MLNGDEAKEVYSLAKQKGVFLMEANKTAHCPAFNHLMVMIKSGVIGEVVDVEASLSKLWDDNLALREFDPRQLSIATNTETLWYSLRESKFVFSNEGWSRYVHERCIPFL